MFGIFSFHKWMCVWMNALESERDMHVCSIENACVFV